jgi:hypothetical protein
MLNDFKFAAETAGPIAIPILLCQVVLRDNITPFFKELNKDFNLQRDLKMPNYL